MARGNPDFFGQSVVNNTGLAKQDTHNFTCSTDTHFESLFDISGKLKIHTIEILSSFVSYDYYFNLEVTLDDTIIFANEFDLEIALETPERETNCFRSKHISLNQKRFLVVLAFPIAVFKRFKLDFYSLYSLGTNLTTSIYYNELDI